MKWLVGLTACLLALPVFAGDGPSAIKVFVSFSMPETALKSWMQEAAMIHAPVIVRGLVNNSFRATLAKMTALASENQGGLQIDPLAFRRYHIEQVPAVVVTLPSNGDVEQPGSAMYRAVYGNVHLAYALAYLARQGSPISPVASAALTGLRNKQHG